MDKVCAFCSRGEKSLLGQGDLTCYEPTPGFNPFKRQLSRVGTRRALSETDETTGRRGQQSLTWRRTRGPMRQQSRHAVEVIFNCRILLVVAIITLWFVRLVFIIINFLLLTMTSLQSSPVFSCIIHHVVFAVTFFRLMTSVSSSTSAQFIIS